MAPKPKPKATPQRGLYLPKPNLASKPHLIGAVIEKLMVDQHKSTAELAAYMGISVREAERWLKVAYLPVPRMMKLSEFFNHNLFAYYIPNVKPLPNPLQEENDKLKALVK